MKKEEIREMALEERDPEYAKLKSDLKKLDREARRLRLELRIKRYDALPEKEKRVRDMLGMNPHKDQIIHRSTERFNSTGSYIKEEK